VRVSSGFATPQTLGIHASIKTNLDANKGPFDAGGVFSISPLSSLNSSRSPSPEAIPLAIPCAMTPSVSNVPEPMEKTPLHGNKSYDKKRGHSNRKKKRKSQQASKPGQLPLPTIQPSTQAKYLYAAALVGTILRTETLPAASTGFVANGGSSGKKSYKVEELIGENAKIKFKLVKWDGMYAKALLSAHPC